MKKKKEKKEKCVYVLRHDLDPCRVRIFKSIKAIKKRTIIFNTSGGIMHDSKALKDYGILRVGDYLILRKEVED